MAGRALMLSLALATGCGGPLADLDIQAIRFNPDSTNGEGGREITVIVEWANPGEPGGLFGGCNEAGDVEITLEDVLLETSILGGEDESGDHCYASERIAMARAGAPQGRGDKTLSLRRGRRAYEVVLDHPFDLRHLTPIDPLSGVTDGSTLRFVVESDERLNVASAFLAPRDGNLDDRNRVRLQTDFTPEQVTVHLPDPYPWGNWQLFVAGRVDVVKSCPVAECAGGAVARTSVSLSHSD